MLDPAKKIIEICGGFEAVAEMTSRSVTRVHRWTYPKERGGTGGLIPADIQQTLMVKARERGLPLTPADFFPPEEREEDAA